LCDLQFLKSLKSPKSPFTVQDGIFTSSPKFEKNIDLKNLFFFTLIALVHLTGNNFHFHFESLPNILNFEAKLLLTKEFEYCLWEKNEKADKVLIFFMIFLRLI
jgi:hypothetical protein